MRIYTDLHIHTALSPCADNDMTPNNIVNMAKLKGLDVVAITDHNSCENVPACIEVAKKVGILVVPGMEIQTREDVHAICLFKDIDSALAFQEYVYKHLPPLKNKEDIFGEQLVFDSEDNIIGHNDIMLLTSAEISFDDACFKVKELEGAFVPAHVDRDSYSAITNLGFVPDYLPVKTIEYNSYDNIIRMKETGILKNSYRFIKSSDAHYLWDILERENYIDVMDLSLNSIIDIL